MRRLLVLCCAFVVAIVFTAGAIDSVTAAETAGGKGLLANGRSCQLFKGCGLRNGAQIFKGRKSKNGAKAPVQNGSQRPVQGPGQTVPDDDDVVPPAPVA